MIKNTVKKLFGKLGLQVSRTSKTSYNHNEIITSRIGDYNMLLNKRHALPNVLKKFPYYSTNLPRLASKVKEKYTDLLLIDVGANIGDTVALNRSKTHFPIVCIEGDDFYFSILKKNITQFKNVEAFHFFLGEKNNIITGRKEIDNGTLKIVTNNDNENSTISIITLDNFLQMNPKFKSAKILKTDTDGFDLRIIRGGLDYIQKTKPVLFFEYDRTMLEGIQENGIDTLNLLENMGYETAMFYDNFGRFLLSTELANKQLISQLHYYIKDNVSSFPYYDIALFHQQDKDIANKFIEDEIAFFKKSKI